jgi:hypothetical protein
MADDLVGSELGDAYPKVASARSAAGRSTGPTAYLISKAKGRSRGRMVRSYQRLLLLEMSTLEPGELRGGDLSGPNSD